MLVLVAACVGLAAVTLTVWVEYQYYGLLTAKLGDFAWHPVLMSLAFMIFAPLAGIVFALQRSIWKVDRSAAKAAHAALHCCALCCGGVGLQSMWQTHERSRYRFHFQTLHSWVGACCYLLYACQWAVSVYAFYTKPAWLSINGNSFIRVHALCGRYLIIGALMVCVLGSLATVWKPQEAEPHPHASSWGDWAAQNTAGVLMLLEAAGVLALLKGRAQAVEEHTLPCCQGEAAQASSQVGVVARIVESKDSRAGGTKGMAKLLCEPLLAGADHHGPRDTGAEGGVGGVATSPYAPRCGRGV